MAIERVFDIPFVADMARREKQIQQNYRPVIGVHKWFARRPGTLFRALLLSEFVEDDPLSYSFFQAHDLSGKVVADPFMGGGTSLIEANRLGFNVIGFDINPMAYWIVRQELVRVDRSMFRKTASIVIDRTEKDIGRFYKTKCGKCGYPAADVKYFLWVKQVKCRDCDCHYDLFRDYVVARNERHTHFAVLCHSCGHLNEVTRIGDQDSLPRCESCDRTLKLSGTARSGKSLCPYCGRDNAYPVASGGPPRHRLFAMEYHCVNCRERHNGRYFKVPDREDLVLFDEASSQATSTAMAYVPEERIPAGDETSRLHRWGYRHYSQLFVSRQLLGLNALATNIAQVSNVEARHALSTVFSDFLRYQNMLCRYDAVALKCLDIFSVHGYPVGLVQCENNLLGIPAIGSGGFRHFVEKYDRAKAYCEEPFETVRRGGSKQIVRIRGEEIRAELVSSAGYSSGRRLAMIASANADAAELPPYSLDAVLTDPPYFANVQYAELMDFCYVWLRKLLVHEVSEFRPATTRCAQELTGNATLGRTMEDFSAGLSAIYSRFAKALKPGAPFVFTYHHNQLAAYAPVVAAILDAGLVCSASFPCPAEMGASIHINGTGSSVVDTIFVCRSTGTVKRSLIAQDLAAIANLVRQDVEILRIGGAKPTLGDTRCILYGHMARLAVWFGRQTWNANIPVADKLKEADLLLNRLCPKGKIDVVAQEVLGSACPTDGFVGELFIREERDAYGDHVSF